MTDKKVVAAGDIVKDISAGLSDNELMVKYNLSAKGLANAFEQLIAKGIVPLEAVRSRKRQGVDAVIIDDSRSLPRHSPRELLPISDAPRAGTWGRVDNINERGVGVTGIDACIGETKELVVSSGTLLPEVESIRFEARCVWVEPHVEPELTAGGYQITRISDRDLANLRALVTRIASEE
jgi:hypothetical protein